MEGVRNCVVGEWDNGEGMGRSLRYYDMMCMANKRLVLHKPNIYTGLMLFA